MYFYYFRCIVAAFFISFAVLISFKTPIASARSSMLEESPNPTARLAEADRLRLQDWQQLNPDDPLQAALQSWQQALNIYRASDVREAFPQESRQGELITLQSIGVIQEFLGQYLQAIENLQQALPISQEIGDRQREATIQQILIQAYYRLSITHQQSGENEQAIEYSQQVLALGQATGNRQYEGHTLVILGNAYADLGQESQAIEFYQQALEVYREVGDRTGEQTLLFNLENRGNLEDRDLSVEVEIN